MDYKVLKNINTDIWTPIKIFSQEHLFNKIIFAHKDNCDNNGDMFLVYTGIVGDGYDIGGVFTSNTKKFEKMNNPDRIIGGHIKGEIQELAYLVVGNWEINILLQDNLIDYPKDSNIIKKLLSNNYNNDDDDFDFNDD